MGTVRLFKHHVHTAFIWLASVEVVLFMLSVLIGSYLRFHGDNSSVEDHIGPILPRALVFAAVLAISMAAMGLYQPRMREGSGGILIRLMGAFIAMSLVMSAIFYLFPALLLWRGALAFIVATAFLFVLISRSIFQHLVDQDRLKRRVLVFGAGHRANQVLSRLRRKSDRRGFKFVGFAPVPGDEEVVDPNSIIRLNGSVYSYALEHEIDEVLVAVGDRRRGYGPRACVVAVEGEPARVLGDLHRGDGAGILFHRHRRGHLHGVGLAGGDDLRRRCGRWWFGRRSRPRSRCGSTTKNGQRHEKYGASHFVPEKDCG